MVKVNIYAQTILTSVVIAAIAGAVLNYLFNRKIERIRTTLNKELEGHKTDLSLDIQKKYHDF